ncbi:MULTISPECIES: glycosyltransferase family 4 protein [Nostocales]|uniref:Glycosyl transferase n=3 Tax=Nostocales TaxID=1161 RepID=A0A0C1R584_9CYAN|nr:glycosyltransferase family 4 protein [Tolypothrix bouteillei]KAF3888365.1 glycosyltransferase [Tolypothrix bouteillei VB521301]
MKVLHLNVSDLIGGASRAAYRLHQGLMGIGVQSQMLVQTQDSNDQTVIGPNTKLGKEFSKLRPALTGLPLKLYPGGELTEYSSSWLPDSIATRVPQLAPDVINLHWISKGYIQIKTLAKLNKPLIWTLHDMWAFTGGCHYSHNCDRYMNSCGACPQLGSDRNWDLSRWQWQSKTKHWRPLHLTLVSPSSWLAKCTQASSLFKNRRVEVIPNGLDIQRYKPVNRQIARGLLNLPQDKQLVLFGAINATSNQRKGFHLLYPALQSLSQSRWCERLELVIFGSSQPQNPPKFGFQSYYLGTLNDDISLALLYAAVDVFIAPSTDDNLPNTVMEALACGTPCVTFNIGGMPDMIEHQKNGYLAQPDNTEDLAQGVAWILENKERHEKLCYFARFKVEQEFTVEKQAYRYLALYDELVNH